MNRILAIETSGEACSVALGIDGEVTEYFEHAPMQHAELLLPAISGLLSAAGLVAPDLDVVAFGRGPGSFTSLRIGIGVVQGLAWGAELPVVPVSSLAAVAQQALDQSADPAAQICVAMDARMQEVFYGQFKRGVNGFVASLGEEVVCAPQAVDFCGNDFIAAGNGYERFAELSGLRDRATQCFPGIWPRASAVLKLAQVWLQDNEPLPAAQAQPVYIRNDVASKPASS